MKYTTGDIFDGYFKDGLPHGHGIRKEGHFMSNAASMYVGEWVSGTKYGYGVMDDIVTGEKYLGNWLDNKKHGGGLIVTSDGVYHEGIFNQDILTVSYLFFREIFYTLVDKFGRFLIRRDLKIMSEVILKGSW